MIRMNFDPGNINSTQELRNKNRFNVYPNPSEGIVILISLIIYVKDLNYYHKCVGKKSF